MRVLTVLTALLLAPLPHAVSQQPLPPLAPGQRVRVTASTLGLDQRIATFRAVEGDVLVVTADEPEWFEVARTTDSLQRVPLGSLQRLEVHAGRRSHPWRGAGIGLLAGVTVGGTLGALQVGSECPSYGCETSPAVSAAMGGVILGGLGALIGAGIGALVKTDTWEEIPLETVRVSIVPQREGRFALGASIAF